MADRYAKALKACILFKLCLQLVMAQNLVPDSSFEMNTFVPMDFSELNASRFWNTPSRGTSDLFCKCDRKTKLFREKIYTQVDVPQNPMGDQYPHSGTCYAGIFAFSHGDYREYLQTPLKEALQKNKTYRFTVYVSLADYSRASVDQLGVCFLKNKTEYSSSDVITDFNPVYITIEHEVGNDIKQWHAVTASYKARGGESYIVFGSFELNKIRKTKIKAPKEARSRINQTTERDAYYFIDDISLVEIYPDEVHDSSVNTEDTTLFEIPSGALLVLKNTLFQTNQAVLLPSSCSGLDAIAAHLKKHPQDQVEVFGYTDNSGNEKSNKKLSAGRAKAVADYLISKGIDAERIIHNGYGSANPVATNATEEGRQQNRRVEFRISKK